MNPLTLRWRNKWIGVIFALCAILFCFTAATAHDLDQAPSNRQLNRRLATTLATLGFTGRIETTLEKRLGRRLDTRLVQIGRFLWFDSILGLNNDNMCGGCHSPTAGFGDTQSIAIGIQNNGIVGPHRAGPRNMRRSPMVINSAFYPRLMWNSRFAAISDNPFDNRAGFFMPDPEGLSLSNQPHLLNAQAFIPPTERAEAAGLDFIGDSDAIRAEVVKRLNDSPAYRWLFSTVFPEVKTGARITYDMLAQAIAEFEFSLTFANAPIDRFARGDYSALSTEEKKGALLFFGSARCVNCHAVSGPSNEMFSDFQNHVIGVPQIVPRNTNNTFAGTSANEDFGREDVTHDAADRYKFRTTPLRNIALQPTFMHNGAFTQLEDAICHHLNAAASASAYTPSAQQLAEDLSGATGPIDPVLARLDPLLTTPISLTKDEFSQLIAFVRHGLLDPRSTPASLKHLIPRKLPSGRPLPVFEANAQTPFQRTASICEIQ